MPSMWEEDLTWVVAGGNGASIETPVDHSNAVFVGYLLLSYRCLGYILFFVPRLRHKLNDPLQFERVLFSQLSLSRRGRMAGLRGHSSSGLERIGFWTDGSCSSPFGGCSDAGHGIIFQPQPRTHGPVIPTDNHQHKQILGGEGGIRTHGRHTPTPDFESGTFDHSATSPNPQLYCVSLNSVVFLQQRFPVLKGFVELLRQFMLARGDVFDPFGITPVKVGVGQSGGQFGLLSF